MDARLAGWLAWKDKGFIRGTGVRRAQYKINIADKPAVVDQGEEPLCGWRERKTR